MLVCQVNFINNSAYCSNNNYKLHELEPKRRNFSLGNMCATIYYRYLPVVIIHASKLPLNFATVTLRLVIFLHSVLFHSIISRNNVPVMLHITYTELQGVWLDPAGVVQSISFGKIRDRPHDALNRTKRIANSLLYS